MSKYSHFDFMPKGEGDNGEAENREAETLFPDENISEDIRPAENTESPEISEYATRDPEIGIVTERTGRANWAFYISLFFSPLLIPTYCVALAMWITPLSLIKENTRLGVTFVVLLVTAMAPTMYRLTVAGFNRFRMNESRLNSAIQGIVFIICQFFGAYYLNCVHAPWWLVMILFSGACTTIAFIVVDSFFALSAHTFAMGGMTAIVYFLGLNKFLDVPVTPWLIGIILISGLVASARLASGNHKLSGVAVGYVLGAVLTYLIMSESLYNFITGIF